MAHSSPGENIKPVSIDGLEPSVAVSVFLIGDVLVKIHPVQTLVCILLLDRSKRPGIRTAGLKSLAAELNPFLGIHQVELSVIGLGPDRDAAGIFYSRLTGFSLFGSYDNHAVRRLGAIDCRSRRIPQDIDCLDI